MKTIEFEPVLRAPLKTYQDRDEYNFDFEQGDSVHRRAGSPSCADQRSSEPKVYRFERLAACCALAALLSPRQGFQPNRWRESLACITANRQSRHMRGFQRCPKCVHLLAEDMQACESVEDVAMLQILKKLTVLLRCN